MSGPEERTLERPARGTRPANRRELIVAAASDLFSRQGYATVGMSEIADAVAIRPSALYKHFRGKSELLATVVREALDRVAATVDRAIADETINFPTALAETVLEHRHVGVLWRREARHLSDADQETLRAEARRIGAGVTAIITRRRPDLEPTAADLLAWSALAVANSVSFHTLTVPEPEFTALLAELVATVLAAPAPRVGERRAHPAGVFAPISRREAILAAAAGLFADRGYTTVGLEDIGAAVGIAGPSVYNHFDGKAQILTAIIFRGDEWLRMDMNRAFARATDPADALRRLLHSYTEFGLDNPHLVQVLVADTAHLPEPDRHRARLAQRSYIAEWVHLLELLHPTWDQTTARIRVQAAQIMINDITLTPHLRDRQGITEALTTTGADLLGL